MIALITVPAFPPSGYVIGPVASQDVAICLSCLVDFIAEGSRTAFRHGFPWMICPICDQAAGVITNPPDDYLA